MAKDLIDSFVTDLRGFNANEMRRCFTQPTIGVAPASMTAVHKAAARLAQCVRAGNGVESAAITLAHRALAVWLAGTSTIGDPQGQLFPIEEGVSAEEVEEMVEEENEIIDRLTAANGSDTEWSPAVDSA